MAYKIADGFGVKIRQEQLAGMFGMVDKRIEMREVMDEASITDYGEWIHNEDWNSRIPQ